MRPCFISWQLSAKATSCIKPYVNQVLVTFRRSFVDSLYFREQRIYNLFLLLIKPFSIQKTLHPFSHVLISRVYILKHIVVCKISHSCQLHFHKGMKSLKAIQPTAKALLICSFQFFNLLLHSQCITCIYCRNKFIR